MDLKMDVLTDSTANFGMQNRVGSGRVRLLDVKWLCTREAVHVGRDVTTKHHDEERLKVMMTLVGLR